MDNMNGQGGQRSLAEIQLEHAQNWGRSRDAKGRITEVERDGDLGCCGCILFFFSILIVFFAFPFSLCIGIKVIAEYERVVIFRLGRVLAGGTKGPGMIFVFPCVDSMQKIDLRTVAYDVPPQEVLTKDSVTVSVDAVVYYRISDPIKAICNVDDAFRSAQFLAATTLRNVLGTKLMAEVLSERDHIAQSMQEILDHATDAWGITIERVEVKDVRLPQQLQRAMAAEAEATREAKAKVVAAEGERNASRALKEAGDVISESPAAMQLRYLQTIGTMSNEHESTILFPMPLDIMGVYKKKGEKSPLQKRSPPAKKKENEQTFWEQKNKQTFEDKSFIREKQKYDFDALESKPAQYELTSQSKVKESKKLSDADSWQPEVRVSINTQQSEPTQTFHREEVTSVYTQRTEPQVYKTSAYTKEVKAETTTAVIVERLDMEPPKRTSAVPSTRQREPDAADGGIRTSSERTVIQYESRPLSGNADNRKSAGSEAGSSSTTGSSTRSSTEIKKGRYSSTIVIKKDGAESTHL